MVEYCTLKGMLNVYISVSIKHGLRTADYGLRTGYKIRTRYKTWTGKYGLGIKHGLRTADYGLLW